MLIVNGGVTAAKGFLANGVKAGIKKSGKKDLAILYSEAPAVAAAAFTTNRFQASPIKVSKMHLKNKMHQAIIVNSGNANCAAGRSGDRNAFLMTEYAGKALGLDRREVLVASTGMIGKPLPIGNVAKAVPSLVNGLSDAGGAAFSESILTTDTAKKESAVRVRLGAAIVTIGGSAKGAGMIYPELAVDRHATMLCFLTTDAAISKGMLDSALADAIADSFNMISVDGDMSTNDSCFILANGLAGNRRISVGDGDYRKFTSAVRYVTACLAKMMVADAEGATKVVEIEVCGAHEANDARAIARKISASNLLKCCIYGHDPNWGRIIAACGASGVGFEPERVDVYIGGMKAMSNGSASPHFDREKAARHLRADEIKIKVDLKSGMGRAVAWTCDLSKEYVAINSEYST